MSNAPKPIQARPVAPPAQQPQQPKAQTERRPATVETVACELFEIRRYLIQANAAKMRAGLLYLIWGGVFILVGTLGAQTDKVGGSIAFVAGMTLMVVGGGMRYDPRREP